MEIKHSNASDLDALKMTDAEIRQAVEEGLIAQGRGDTVLKSRCRLLPDPDFQGHFNVLRGYMAPIETPGVKVVGRQRPV